MTEKEKMQQQMLYDANYDTELIRERQVAKDVTFGDNVFIAPNCGFYTAGHPIDADRRSRQTLNYSTPLYSMLLHTPPQIME